MQPSGYCLIHIIVLVHYPLNVNIFPIATPNSRTIDWTLNKIMPHLIVHQCKTFYRPEVIRHRLNIIGKITRLRLE